jgi:plasmid stabilization system protein ParE
MVYSVRVTLRAERDLAGIFEYVNAGTSKKARTWYQGLRKAILSLERAPKRNSNTPESMKYRHLLYGRRRYVYRVIYRVFERERQVEILHIRHGAMKGFTPLELE